MYKENVFTQIGSKKATSSSTFLPENENAIQNVPALMSYNYARQPMNRFPLRALMVWWATGIVSSHKIHFSESNQCSCLF